jgi:hypothetical protein
MTVIVKKICPGCNNEFTQEVPSLLSYIRIFCSPQCHGNYQSRMMRKCYGKARKENPLQFNVISTPKGRRKKLENARKGGKE